MALRIVTADERLAEALREALASGVLTVQCGDKRVTYRSVAELREALAEIEAALARDAGAPDPPQPRARGSE